MSVIEVDITGLATGGEAVGRQLDGAGAGRAVFVPFAAPGELIRAQVTEEKKRFARARLVEILRPGPDRVKPACPVFERCGGCQWQHIAPAAQRVAKGAIVARALGVPVLQAEAAVPEWGYRDRVRVQVDWGREGELSIGFHAQRSHEVVDVPACPLLSPAVAAAWPALRAFAREVPVGSEIAVQAGRDGVLARCGDQARWLDSAGARTAVPNALVDVSEAGGRPLRIAARAFAQVGAVANGRLVDVVRSFVGAAPGTVWELYAGAGNFTRHLVTVSPQVLATDGDVAACRRGAENVPEARWVRPEELQRFPTPHTVLLDPPREGADHLHLALAQRATQQIVYVSCDPQTLARDAKILVANGFAIDQVRALDLMPQTYHVETVVRFVRTSAIQVT